MVRQTPFIHISILMAFLANTIGPFPKAIADDFRLPAPGVMVHLSPPLDPPILKGIKVHPENPFRFDFILDKGGSKLGNDQLKEESSKLIKYFLTSLTIPEKDLWVNLSPYEKDRIIPNSFGLTEMGRDLLAEDYMLKQITASLIYPEDKVGKKFWKRIYEEAFKRYGTTNIPVNTFNKVWIVPEKAVVFENAKAGTAYVVESKLRVMLEEDYLSLEKHEGIQPGQAQSGNTNELGSQVVREIVIPELTKEVNEDKNFAKLRQVYNSLILATWYKKKIKDSILSQVYADKNKVAGVNINDPREKERIYQKYLRAFKKGVFNYIKEDTDTLTKETIPRKYFSGGFSLFIGNKFVIRRSISKAMSVQNLKLLFITAFLMGATAFNSNAFPQNSSQSPQAQVGGSLQDLIAPLRDPDEKVRMSAFAVLSNREIPGLAPALRKELDENPYGDVRLDIIGNFGTRNDPIAEEAEIYTLSNDPNPEMREAAADALMGRKSPVVIAALTNALPKETNWKVYREIVGDLIEMGANPLDIITNSLKNPNGRRPFETIGFLYSRKFPGLGEALTVALKDNGDSKVRAIISDLEKNPSDPILVGMAINVLKRNLIPMYGRENVWGEITKDTPMEELIPAFNSADPTERNLAFFYLSRIGSSEVVNALQGPQGEALITDLENNINAGVRKAAVAVKADTKNTLLIIDLVSALRKTAGPIDDYKEMDADAPIEDLMANYNLSNPDARRDAVGVIGRYNLPGTIEFLEFATEDPNRFVREEATKDLSYKDGPVAVKALIAALDNSNRNVRVLAAFGLQNRDSSSGVVEALRSHLNEHDLQGPVIRALRNKYYPEAIKDSISVLNDPDSSPDARIEAISALSKHTGPEVEGALKHTADKDPDPEVREQAARALESQAMIGTQKFVKAEVVNNGGIDLTPENMHLQTQNIGGEIKFHMDPAVLKQLQNTPGFVPVITSIQPMTDLRQFLSAVE